MVSFNDAIPFMPIEQIICNIDPVQDLHGYDAPWPAGGGKNLALIEDINAPSTSDTTIIFPSVLPQGDYVLSFDVSAVRENIGGTSICGIIDSTDTKHYLTDFNFLNVSNNATMNSAGANVSGRYYAKYTTSDIKGVVFFWRTNSYAQFSSGSAKNIMLESGTSPTSFAPYSNICPITGHTGANVYNEAEYDESATPKLSITFPDPPGTVYGGTLTVNEDGSGVLKAEYVSVTVDETGWADPGDNVILTTKDAVLGGRYKSAESGSAARIIYGLSNYFSTISNGALDNSIVRSNGVNTDKLQIVDYKTTFSVSTFAEFKAIVEDNPVQVVYKLATPLTYNLTDQDVIETLQGENNVWCDTGDITVTYQSTSSEKDLTRFVGMEYNTLNLKLFNDLYIEHG